LVGSVTKGTRLEVPKGKGSGGVIVQHPDLKNKNISQRSMIDIMYTGPGPAAARKGLFVQKGGLCLECRGDPVDKRRKKEGNPPLHTCALKESRWLDKREEHCAGRSHTLLQKAPHWGRKKIGPHRVIKSSSIGRKKCPPSDLGGNDMKKGRGGEIAPLYF